MSSAEQNQTVAAYLALPEAAVAWSLLRSAEIDAELFDDEVASLYWSYIPALGGIRLSVPGHQAEEARALLQEPFTPDALSTEDSAYVASAQWRRRVRGAIVLAFSAFGVEILLGAGLLSLARRASKRAHPE